MPGVKRERERERGTTTHSPEMEEKEEEDVRGVAWHAQPHSSQVSTFKE